MVPATISDAEALPRLMRMANGISVSTGGLRVSYVMLLSSTFPFVVTTFFSLGKKNIANIHSLKQQSTGLPRKSSTIIFAPLSFRLMTAFLTSFPARG